MKNTLEMTIHNEAFGSQATLLRCTRLLRSISGRRVVYEGLCNKQPAVIKIFLSAAHGKRHFKRELRGLKELAARGLKTANIPAFGRNDQGHFVLVLDKIENATDLFSLIESAKDLKDVKQAMKAVFAYIATMHTAGVVQHDLHLGNFLWNGKTIYALDPAEMVFANNPPGRKTSFQQLAMLFSSLPESVWSDRENLLKIYFQTRKWDLKDRDIERIRELTAKHRLQHMGRMLRKTLRTSKRYMKQKRDALSGVFAQDIFEKQDLDAVLLNIDEKMENGQILKRGNTCFVSKIRVNNHDVVVKRYNHKSLWHSFRHTLKRSRARHCWLFGHRLTGLEIPCARPVAFIEQRQYGLIWQSYILNEFLDGPELCDAMRAADLTEQQKKEIVEKSEQLLNTLSDARMTHGDMKPGNVLICEGQPMLIDLDSMKLHFFSQTLEFYKNKMLSCFHDRLHRR